LVKNAAVVAKTQLRVQTCSHGVMGALTEFGKNQQARHFCHIEPQARQNRRISRASDVERLTANRAQPSRSCTYGGSASLCPEISPQHSRHRCLNPASNVR
jgi:hypothetical protein